MLIPRHIVGLNKQDKMGVKTMRIIIIDDHKNHCILNNANAKSIVLNNTGIQELFGIDDNDNYYLYKSRGRYAPHCEICSKLYAQRDARRSKNK